MEEELAASAGGSSLPLLAGLGLVIALIFLAIRFVQTSPKVSKLVETKTKNGSTSDKQIDNKVQLNPQADATYLVNCLRPTSTPLEILYAIATTPDTVAVTSKHLDMAEDLREKKRASLAEKSKEASHKSTADLVDDDGWAEDDEDDPAAAAAKKAQEEKDKEAKRLAKATGKDKTDLSKVKLEGVDEGVLGQEWVVANLTKMGAWPPPSMNDTIVKDKKFSVDGNIVGPLDHPGVRRALIMTMGRLNAKQLNTHPELMAAGPKGLIDPTYFQATMEYRQRVGQVLEGTLRMACTLRSYRLACSILDAIIMFKIGLVDADSEEHKAWFHDLMTKQYGPAGTPKLIIEQKFLGVPTPEPEKKDAAESDAEKKEAEKNKIAQQIMQTKQVTTTDEKMALEMTITRQHAESFTKQKIAQCQKQGIPPQVALQSYREAWFILVRARKINLDGSHIPSWDGVLGDPRFPANNHMDSLKKKDDPLYKMLDSDTVASFKKEFATSSSNCENRIVIGWPFVISNVAQKTGNIKIHLPPPIEAGRYEFSVTIKSQEFLGVGEEFKLVVDVAEGVEKKKEEEVEEDSENKKDK
eukprot:CAMPEP_0172303894 /NCGR_PEP_ID=MMETSP1058-20130122/5399_1 /TAXON_ID=83371 /ORGANISM="Detonula confervacea, Strain CCMP 353" /LENGTH=582 /DNA_ID=CAMNT_0013014931 /DNA_START=26 /DNA_END=1774 /DNA_ORIENTATION=-